MCFDRNINGNGDVKFLIGIIGHCTDQRKLLYIGNARNSTSTNFIPIVLKIVLVEFVLVETVLVGDPLYSHMIFE